MSGPGRADETGAGAGDQRIRVAHLTTVHSPFDSRIFERQCRSLVREGYAVSLVAPHDAGVDGAEDNDLYLAGVDLVPLAPPGGRLRRWSLGPACYRAALETGADLFHLHDPELLPLGVLLQRRGVPVVADLHENFGLDLRSKPWIPKPMRRPASWLGSAVERWATSRLAHVVAATPSIAAQFAETDVTVIANFPDCSGLANSPSPYADRPARVLYAGELARSRGSLLLARVAARLRGEVQFVVAGRFSSGTERDLACAEPGWPLLDSRGMLGFREVTSLIGASRVGLVFYDSSPNHLDAWPRKLFEYMAGAVPVVYSDLPGMRRLLEPIGCGLAVPWDDVEAVASAVTWLLDHAAEAEEMGRRGRHAVEQELNWDHERAKLLALYRRLLDPRTPSRSGSTAGSGRD